MDYNGYEIIHFRADLLDGVLNVLCYHWGDDYERNRAYFQWKYMRNPYTKNPLGIVALHKGKVVGFRGYFVSKYEITGSQKDIIVLGSGDVCVHPDHRLKGLFIATGKMAMDEYASIYPIFFSFTVSRNSMPGALKSGFVPLINRACLNRCNLLGIMGFMLSANKKKDLYQGKIRFGDFGDIEVSDRPKPEDMHAVISEQKFSDKTIRLVRDKKFFQWRFNNNRNKYVFYYYKQNKKVTGYVVVRVTANNLRAYIIDYAEQDSTTLEKILAFIIKNKHFNILSIYNYSVTGQMANALKKLKFRTNSVLRMIERKLEGEFPLIVRPVEKNYDETHFIVHGLDIRKIQNWSIKEICSDGS